MRKASSVLGGERKVWILISSLLFTSRPLVNNHLVAILRTLGARLPRSFALCIPSPNRTRVFVTLRFTTSTTVRVITSERDGDELQ